MGFCAISGEKGINGRAYGCPACVTHWLVNVSTSAWDAQSPQSAILDGWIQPNGDGGGHKNSPVLTHVHAGTLRCFEGSQFEIVRDICM